MKYQITYFYEGKDVHYMYAQTKKAAEIARQHCSSVIGNARIRDKKNFIKKEKQIC